MPIANKRHCAQQQTVATRKERPRTVTVEEKPRSVGRSDAPPPLAAADMSSARLLPVGGAATLLSCCCCAKLRGRLAVEPAAAAAAEAEEDVDTVRCVVGLVWATSRLVGSSWVGSDATRLDERLRACEGGGAAGRGVAEEAEALLGPVWGCCLSIARGGAGRGAAWTAASERCGGAGDGEAAKAGCHLGPKRPWILRRSSLDLNCRSISAVGAPCAQAEPW